MQVPKILSVLSLAAAPAAVFAHTGHAGDASFMAGVIHPLGGLDHLLAMLAVGLWAAQCGGRALWAVPLAFVAAMAAGGLAGAAGLVLPAVELGIAGSVIAFGGLIAFARRLPLAIGMALTGAFALFHGQAHVAEMAAGGSLPVYGAGFLLATVALHLSGAGVGLIARLPLGRALLRVAGGGMGVTGVAMLAGLA